MSQIKLLSKYLTWINKFICHLPWLENPIALLIHTLTQFLQNKWVFFFELIGSPLNLIPQLLDFLIQIIEQFLKRILANLPKFLTTFFMSLHIYMKYSLLTCNTITIDFRDEWFLIGAMRVHILAELQAFFWFRSQDTFGIFVYCFLLSGLGVFCHGLRILGTRAN
jgi:hypothetical protein